MRDGASTNNVAMRTMALVYPSMLDVGCFPHTLNHVGDHFHTPTLRDFDQNTLEGADREDDGKLQSHPVVE